MPYTNTIQCRNCGNKSPMKIVARHEYSRIENDEKSKFVWDYGEIWLLIACPACSGVNVGVVKWIDEHPLLEHEPLKLKIVYPAQNKTLTGLPPEIDKAFDSALKVRSIDSNAFAVLLGRVLDLVCLDRKAEGKSLHERLTNMADRGEMPPKLAHMAQQLRQLRNIGAHADLGELTPAEIPVLLDLCRAILEYVYTAPELMKQAEERLKQLKSS